jgi:hypothetical protein
MNMQVSTPQEMTEAFLAKLCLNVAGRSGAPASDEPFLAAACAAGFVVAELLAMRRRSQYFCRHSEP